MLSAVTRLFYLERIGITATVFVVLAIIGFALTKKPISKVEKKVTALYLSSSKDMNDIFRSAKSVSQETINRRLRVQQAYRDSLENSTDMTEKQISAQMQSIEFTHRMLEAEVLAIREDSPLYQYGVQRKGFSFKSFFLHIFLHKGYIHLIVNLYFLYILGTVIERYWHPAKVAATLVIITIISGVSYTLLAKLPFLFTNIPFYGFSALNAGLVGVFLCRRNEIREQMPYVSRTKVSMLPWLFIFYLVLNLVIGIVLSSFPPLIFYVTHLFTFLIGLLCGFIIPGHLRYAGDVIEEEAKMVYQEPAPVSESADEKASPEKEPIAASGTAAQAQRPVPNVPREYITGWQCFEKGEMAVAVENIIAAMEIFLRDVVRFSSELDTHMQRIYSLHKQLIIPVESYYQWAMECEVNGLKKSALLAYELCAQYASDDVEFRLRSLLKSGELRVEIGDNIARAKQVFQCIIANDTKGGLRRQAEYALEQLSH